METYAIPLTKEIITLTTDENGEPLFNAIQPRDQYQLSDITAPWNRPDAISSNPEDYPDQFWTPPNIIPFIKLNQPSYNPLTHTIDPIIIWSETAATRDWVIRDLTEAEKAIASRKTWQNSRDFLAEFTMTEIGSIGVSTDPTIAALRLILSTWPGSVYSDDQRVITGLDAIEAAGIITTKRRNQIITK